MSHNEHIFKNENSYFHIKKQCMICWNRPKKCLSYRRLKSIEAAKSVLRKMNEFSEGSKAKSQRNVASFPPKAVQSRAVSDSLFSFIARLTLMRKTAYILKPTVLHGSNIMLHMRCFSPTDPQMFP